MVKISSPAAETAKRKQVFVVAGQHGDEPAGPEGALTLIEQFASNVDPAVEASLHNVDIFIVPVANPDGLAAGTRRTGKRIDLNRDWSSRHSTEARAIWSCVAGLRPDVLLDLHEDTPADRAGTYARIACGTRASRAALAKSLASQGYHVPVSAGRKSGRLLHTTFARVFARPAYLVETKFTGGCDTGLAKRAHVHLTAVMSVVKGLASESESDPQGFLDTTLARQILQYSKDGNAAAIAAEVAQDSTLVARTDRNGATLLHYVVQGGNLEAVGALIGHRADVNAPKNDGMTPLHMAAALGHSKVASALLAAGANPGAKDAKGRTPCDVALERGQKVIVELLSKAMNQGEAKSQ